MPSFRDKVRNKTQARNRLKGKNEDESIGCLGTIFVVIAVIVGIVFGEDEQKQKKSSGGQTGVNAPPPRRERPSEPDGRASVNWGEVKPSDSNGSNNSNGSSNGNSSGGSFDSGGGEWGSGKK